MDDFRALNYAPIMKVFGSAIARFKATCIWKQGLLNYLKNMWLGTHKNWSTLGVRVPFTNNSMESFIGRLKVQGAQRERIKFGWFLYTMTKKMPFWSKKTVTIIPIPLWKLAVETAKDNPHVSANTEVIAALFSHNGVPGSYTQR